PDVKHSQRLLNHFGEGTAYSHDLANALHLAPDAGRGTLELGKIPPRHLAHELVESWLKEGGRAPRDAVRDIGQCAAERKLRCDVGQWVASRLAGKGTRARQPGVDLDDTIIRALRVERVLDVALANHTQMTDGADRYCAKELVFLIVERLGWRNHNGFTR